MGEGHGQGPTISTHILDAEHGRPMAGVVVRVTRQSEDGRGASVSGVTDADGRIRRLTEDPLEPGVYVMAFELGGPFFHEVSLTIVVHDTSRSYHVPVLLSPYSLTTYRGS